MHTSTQWHIRDLLYVCVMSHSQSQTEQCPTGAPVERRPLPPSGGRRSVQQQVALLLAEQWQKDSLLKFFSFLFSVVFACGQRSDLSADRNLIIINYPSKTRKRIAEWIHEFVSSLLLLSLQVLPCFPRRERRQVRRGNSRLPEVRNATVARIILSLLPLKLTAIGSLSTGHVTSCGAPPVTSGCWCLMTVSGTCPVITCSSGESAGGGASGASMTGFTSLSRSWYFQDVQQNQT